MPAIFDIALKKDELSRNLGGGLPNNSIIVMQGNDGAGKSIVCQRIAYGLLANGQSVTYISTELDLSSFALQMRSVGYKVDDYILDEKLLFVPMFPFIGSSKFKMDFLDRLMSTKEIFENEVIIFDTLSFFILNDEINDTNIFNIIHFLKRLINLDKTVIIALDPTNINKRFLSILTSVSDGILNVALKEFLGNLIRVIEVVRYRRSITVPSTRIPFRVEPGVGIAIEVSTLA
jgi:archaeal flagellar protein FlaH